MDELAELPKHTWTCFIPTLPALTLTLSIVQENQAAMVHEILENNVT